jgi:hypothetical protein
MRFYFYERSYRQTLLGIHMMKYRLVSVFNIDNIYQVLSILKMWCSSNILFSKKTHIIILSGLVIIPNVNAAAISLDNESAIVQDGSEPNVAQDVFENDYGVLIDEEEIKILKDSYISPYNYLQDPIALNMGYDTRASDSTGTYHGGLSVIGSGNFPVNGSNSAFNTEIGQIWGQTGRFKGFALGGGMTATFNTTRNSHPTPNYTTTGVLAPVQAYVNYQYSNKVDITAGNILINTPWVNSADTNPGSSYAMGNNTYQGALINIQAMPSLLITGFTARGYIQYPNSWYSPQTLYNTHGGVFTTHQPTSGPSGLGLTWNPVDSYTGKLWLYNMADYANMAYMDDSYHLNLSKTYSMDFAFQAFTQKSTGNSITNTITLPGQTGTAGYVSSHGVGARIALNIANNTTSISYNNIFGRDGSFLNGGMVSPYTYDNETDPLYTTVALNSLAELGSGSAYAIRNSTSFMDNTLKFNLTFSQFFVNKTYTSQVDLLTEYDATLIYRIPHTTMNIWTRVSYVDRADIAGGNKWAPRVIYNWTF